MKISILNKQKNIPVNKELREIIKNIIKKAVEIEKIEYSFEVCISLVGNTGIRKLNRHYRNMDKPTDVLSFPIFEASEIKKIPAKNLGNQIIALGDVVVSLEKAEEQAEEYNHSFEREVGYLVTHGFLHLLGYDHMKKKEKEIMREKEEQIMNMMNLERNEKKGGCKS